MIVSMTGYGRVEKKYTDFDLNIEIKSLNSRYLDVHTKLHDSLYKYENDIISLVRKKCIRGKIYILIGGNILSRGLTLEGLTVSYFLRTASTYDTLLQMGRWFGFRNGYSDLPRVWMTRTLERNFYRLALVEQEIRDDIKIYEETSYTPLQFGVRIRRLPGIQVTSRLKMKDAVDNKITFDNLEFKDEIYIGIRPEDISLKSNHEIQVDVKVDLIENLGFEKIIYSKVSENQIIIKSSENINNHSLKISFSKDKVLFFDKDKNRIR